MPPGLHAELARAAEREGVSLNGYITSRLGESVGWRRADEGTVAEQPAEQARPSKTLVWALVANAAAVVLAAAAAIVILLVALLT
jgi:HicB family